jgi:hypothetical protein
MSSDVETSLALFLSDASVTPGKCPHLNPLPEGEAAAILLARVFGALNYDRRNPISVFAMRRCPWILAR